MTLARLPEGTSFRALKNMIVTLDSILFLKKKCFLKKKSLKSFKQGSYPTRFILYKKINLILGDKKIKYFHFW